MNNIKYIQNLRNLFFNNKEQVSSLEYTKSNYDDQGNLIVDKIPTLTTDFCEIGIYKNNLYFVYIIESKFYSKNLFQALIKFKNIQIYGFNNFKENLYPKDGFDYKIFEKEIKSEKYFQVQFNFDIKKVKQLELLSNYQVLKDLLKKNKVKVVDQLEVDLVKK